MPCPSLLVAPSTSARSPATARLRCRRLASGEANPRTISSMTEGDPVSIRRSDSAHEGCGASACTTLTGPYAVSIVIASGMLQSAARHLRCSCDESPSSHSDSSGGGAPRFPLKQLNTRRSWLPSTPAFLPPPIAFGRTGGIALLRSGRPVIRAGCRRIALLESCHRGVGRRFLAFGQSPVSTSLSGSASAFSAVAARSASAAAPVAATWVCAQTSIILPPSSPF